MVDDGRRGHGLARPRWTLDQAEGTLQYCLHSIHLHHNKHKTPCINIRVLRHWRVWECIPKTVQSLFCWRTHLWVVEVWQALCCEALWQLALDDHILNFVSQQFVVDVTRHRSLIYSKGLQSTLHPGWWRQEAHWVEVQKYIEGWEFREVYLLVYLKFSHSSLEQLAQKPSNVTL